MNQNTSSTKNETTDISDINNKIKIISSGSDELVGDNFVPTLKSIFEKRQPIVYWGTATTGCPHFAYLVPLLKIKDFLITGCNVKILIADLHAMLDSQKSSYDLLEARSTFYKTLIHKLLIKIGVSEETLKSVSLSFHHGSSFQLTSKYSLDLLKLSSTTSIRNATKAGTEVVKQQANPDLGSLIYPLMQALDEEYLNCDIQMGGRDQRKIFMFAAEALPKIGYKKRLHLLTPMLSALNSDNEKGEVKMSSSEKNSKIDFFDSEKIIKGKMKKAFAKPGDIKNTPFLGLLKNIVFRKDGNFLVKRNENYGGDKLYESYEELEKDYEEGKLHPSDLKLSLGEYISDFVEDLRKDILEGELKKSFVEGYEERAKELGLI